MEDIYNQTGTLAPLLSRTNYSEDEKTVLLHFFTNIDKNVYCATDALSSQLYAFLVGQYSRSALSMRDRFLKLFEDAQKAFEENKISSEDFISLKDLAEEIRTNPKNAIKYFNDRSSAFLKKWGVNFGHNSLKDADRIRFAVENISQVFTNVIEAPFPCLGDFQEKSTRYMNFTKENLIYSPVLQKSRFAGQIQQFTEKLLDIYEKYLPVIKDALVANNIINRNDFPKEAVFNNTLNAKAFDIVRYLLPSSVVTSLGAGFSARTVEYHLTWMLSHPLEEVRKVAKTMHEEALKVSPGLLSHVEQNDYFIKKREKARAMVNDIFEKTQQPVIQHGIDDCNRIKLISADNIDNIVAASILYHHGRQKGVSFQDCLNRAEYLPDNVKEKIMGAELEDRGEFDRMPRSIRHGQILFDMLIDFGAHRDIMRHRASPQLYHGVSAIHGYDYPEYIDLPGLEEFKQVYDTIMTQISELSQEIIKEYPYETEYFAALGHLLRGTFQMDPGQLAYVLELRTTPQGHQSYRRLFQQVYKIMQEKAPIYTKYIRINQNLEASRMKQEIKASENNRM